MRYRITCLTPTLIGDGSKLSPIDYMVWKDQVNILDQRRIFKLLAKGPRLEGYLAQLRKAEKLDFASWGGFAQNFAERRIPFEHPSLAAIWEKQRAESLFIPCFCAGPQGPYFPASALRGALHTGLLHARWSPSLWKTVQERLQANRTPSRAAESAEEAAMGPSGYNLMRRFAIADSRPVSPNVMKIYLLRTASLASRGGGVELTWKSNGRGSLEHARMAESAAQFCEMAQPGTVFEGTWFERRYLTNASCSKILRWSNPPDAHALLQAANLHSERLLASHRKFAEAARLTKLAQNLVGLEARLAECRAAGTACLLQVGWGAGFLSKSAVPDAEQEQHHRILRQIANYSRAGQAGLPFPKTRRVVLLNDTPAALPGWVQLELEQAS